MLSFLCSISYVQLPSFGLFIYNSIIDQLYCLKILSCVFIILALVDKRDIKIEFNYPIMSVIESNNLVM